MTKFLSNTIITRFFNRYTSKGLILIVLQLESIGFFPSGFSSLLVDMGVKEISTWLILLIGFYFIVHRPKKSSNKIDALKENLELLKVLVEILKTLKKLKKYQK